MTKAEQAQIGAVLPFTGTNRIESGIVTTNTPLIGSPTPRIHSKLNDLPGRGQEMIDFSREIGLPLMPWQEFIAIHAHKIKPDGRWAHPVVAVVVARQSGKSTLMLLRILAGLYLWNDGLQIATAHRLTTSLESFRHLVSFIEGNDKLASEVKKIRWAHGSEEIELKNGNRIMIKAGGAAARGISRPETVFMDELREMKELESFASLRYTMMAAKNPQVWGISNAGDQHSLVLNQIRDRGIVAAAGGSDDIGYFEWSAATDDISDPKNWIAANPALGHTIHEDNIKAVLNDPPDIVRTEVLCRWVSTISSAIPQDEWNKCGEDTADLDPTKITWLGLDLSPDRRSASLVAGQKLDNEKFIIKLLHTWHNPVSLDDLSVANEVAHYARKYNTECVAYSKRTASAVASRLQPAGIAISDIDGSRYTMACDQLLGAVTSNRLVHANQAELTKQILSAVRLPFGDGAWVIGRKASAADVSACVASALVSSYATRPEVEMDILVG